MGDSLETIIQLTAMPLDADTAFTLVDGPYALKSNERVQASDVALDQLMPKVSDSELFLGLLNHGNFIEIAAERQRLSEGQATANIQRWVKIATQVLMMQEGFFFRLMRSQILSPFRRTGDMQEMINDCKASMISSVNSPAVSISEISWDAVSYKIPLSTAECLLQTYPDLRTQLTPGQLAVLDEIEEQCRYTIEVKCAEFRQRTNSVADEFISDQSIYIETKITKSLDYSREQRFNAMGKSTLVTYVDKMQSLFASGHLPGAISPAKIFACQDIKSLTDLRTSILSGAQALIAETRADNKDSMRPAEFAPEDEIPLLNDAREVMRGKTSGMQQVLAKTLGEKSVPNAALTNQIAGGANSLGQSLDLAAKDAVMNLDEGQDHQLAEQIALLLSCVRVRLNAVQESPFELVTVEDFDHLEIVKQLTRYIPTTITDSVHRTAVMLLTTFEEGHNVVKFQGKDLPPELVQYLDYCLDGNIAQMLKSVPALSSDPSMMGRYKRYMLQTMAQKNRLQSEVKERLKRRIAVSLAFD